MIDNEVNTILEGLLERISDLESRVHELEGLICQLRIQLDNQKVEIQILKEGGNF